ncbi:RsmE family RNA methyltransferase [uncultured Rikenella sp.]|uniref:RsmE family RNA methyltransferase n=1 Tax=uncultured Rikenella sp. TaxID=368003 RepID=UPI0025FB7732|nr:RsmE family RNA methyltransferase [uncultured Rikenella sp.]
MHLFYIPDITADVDLYTLADDETRHASGVLRLRGGDRVRLTDGCGGWYEAEIVGGATPKACSVRILSRETEHGVRPYRLHVAIAPTKNVDRYEWFLEKATEIGIDRITPLVCEHSERKTVRRDRSEKIVLSAVKQSLKAYVPRLDEATPFRDFIASADTLYKSRFVAYCDEGTPLAERVELFPALRDAAVGVSGAEFCVLIGPEGDFSPTEIAAARAVGFVPVSLGESRLRTETAGVMATAVAQLAVQCGLGNDGYENLKGDAPRIGKKQ